MTNRLESESTLLDSVMQLESILRARATHKHGSEDADLYKTLRECLLDVDRVNSLVPQCVRTCRTLDQFWEFIKPKFAHYAERRAYLSSEFEPLLEYLEGFNSSPIEESMDDVLKEFSTKSVAIVWERANDRLGNEPDAAITSARSLIESVCKHILEEVGEESNDHDNIYRQTSRLLDLAPDQQSEEQFRQLAGACNAIVGSLNSIRNNFADAHGRGELETPPSLRHAELAVNVAGSLALFLVRTRLEQRR